MSWNARRYHKPDRNYHHLTAKSLGGSNRAFNLLFIKRDRHILLHKIFGLSDLEQIIETLKRLQRMKERQKNVPELLPAMQLDYSRRGYDGFAGRRNVDAPALLQEQPAA